LAHEFALRGLSVERQRVVPVSYKGVQLECGYRMDFVVCAQLVVEVKAVERLSPVHEAQLISYLRLANIPVGLLVNFHVEILRHGLRRLTLNPPR
jgi:GxxExxY protein